jgi:aspartate racemase
MIETARNLEESGADFLIMPCNTAHYFFKDFQEVITIPILHMIKFSALFAKNNCPYIKKAGLLATDGTIISKLYHDYYREQGIEIITPIDKSQKRVMKAIYQHIKRGDLCTGREIMLEEAKNLIKRGAEAILNGCTEVSLVLANGDIEVPIIDSLQVIAEEAVKHASGKD